MPCPGSSRSTFTRSVIVIPLEAPFKSSMMLMGHAMSWSSSSTFTRSVIVIPLEAPLKSITFAVPNACPLFRGLQKVLKGKIFPTLPENISPFKGNNVALLERMKMSWRYPI
ncbi:hypothetical protein M8J77_000401 [Diaphorina citri]|nr:hypothetical protein M8J77_000401 [Diaphorina citri]